MAVIHTLNYQEEERALQTMKTDAQKKCRATIAKVVACTKTKTLSLYWPFSACEVERLAMSACLSQFTGSDVQDGIRRDLLKRKIAYLDTHK